MDFKNVVDRAAATVCEDRPAAAQIPCEQAIFTSVRTPMGEGYRIIAGSPGLRPEERQVITKNAPSHDALCEKSAEATGMAFYTLPTGRLCVTHSGSAGNEHTGRGGLRIYTTCVVFDAEHFARAQFNPFHIVRAMQGAGLTEPKLKPKPQLPKVDLSLESDEHWARDIRSADILNEQARLFVVQELLEQKDLLVCVDGDYEQAAEAFLLTLPGPMRAKFDIFAGMKFSIGRKANLTLAKYDLVTEQRITGQALTLVKDKSATPGGIDKNDWLEFIDRHLRENRIRELADKTSKPFSDVTPSARQRVARIYLAFDHIGNAEIKELLATGTEYLGAKATNCERDLIDDLLSQVQRKLTERFSSCDDVLAERHWLTLIEVWKRGPQAAAWAQPMINTILRSICREWPMVAAELSLAVARNVPDEAEALGHGVTLDTVLESFAEADFDDLPEVQQEHLQSICKRWQAIRPDCPQVAKLAERYLQDASSSDNGSSH